MCLHLHDPFMVGPLILRNTQAVCHIIFQVKARRTYTEDDGIMKRDNSIMKRDDGTCIG